MTQERIIQLLKEWFMERSGQDYYDYYGEPHWYGDESDIKGFAEELAAEIKQ